MDEPTKNRINQIIKSREATVTYDNQFTKRDALLKILRDAGADSHSQLVALARIEELFGVKL